MQKKNCLNGSRTKFHNGYAILKLESLETRLHF